jgi:hypothetical protein
LNQDCSWIGDQPGPLALARSSDEQHLVRDVELAEELGIRYGDTFRKHYGRTEEHRRAAACQARLWETIAATHGVSAAQVQAARSQRPAVADRTTLALFALLYGIVAHKVVQVLRTHHGLAGVRAAVLGYGSTGITLSGVALVGLNLVWVPIVEMVRTGNTHRSLRLAPLPWPNHSGTLFVAGVVTFAAIAATNHVLRRSREHDA